MLKESLATHQPVIFYGDDEEFLLKEVKQIAREMLLVSSQAKSKLDSGNHPDLKIFEPEGKSFLYTTEMIQSFREDIAYPPYEGGVKVYLLLHADRMLPMHANALLKTLEEKPDYAVILLMTTLFSNILPTIASRSHKILLASPKGEKKKERETLEKARLLWGARKEKDLTLLLDLLEKISDDEGEEMLEDLYELIQTDRALSEKERKVLLETIPVAEKALDSHVRLRHILEMVLLTDFLT